MEIYKNKQYSVDERAQNLLSLMTLDEKIEQMHVENDVGRLAKEVKEGKVQHFFGALFGIRVTHTKDLVALQKYALEKTRLGIPLLLCSEGLHGLGYPNATVYPQNIGFSCSFNDELMEKIAREIGREAHNRGFRQIFAPNIDVARELRWGRTQETYGEDPFLVGKFGAAYVRGLQSQQVAATLKHYIGYSVPENGLNISAGHLGEREIRELMLPPYAEAVKAGAWSVMPAYNEVDGEPLHASKKWVNDVLRDELGFEGTVISDWGGVMMLGWLHRIAKEPWKAGKLAIEAGVDIEAPDYYGYGDEFKEKVRSGEIPMELIDRAVLRILKLKFRLGLFDGNAFGNKKTMRTKKSVALARKAAEQSVVLLKNDGILPLNKEKRQKIAVIGPSANRAQVGDYSPNPPHKDVISLYRGLKDKLGEEYVLYARGCNYFTREDEELAKAVETAKQADVVVLVLGDNSLFFGGVGWGDDDVKDPVNNGEGFDVTSLDLPDAQKELFQAVKAVGKPVVLTTYAGRPLTIVNEFENSNAVLQAWYPGEQGGVAIADILFGDVNPSAKLTTSMPRSVGHLPCYYNHRVSSRGAVYKKYGSPEQPGRDYVFDSPKAFLPFGYGLSYTKYEYAGLKVRRLDDGKAEVSVKITNVGERDGEEIALVFVKNEYADFAPYEKQLKGYKRVALKSGQSKRVKIILDQDAFSGVDKNMKRTLIQGKHTVMVQDLKTELFL